MRGIEENRKMQIRFTITCSFIPKEAGVGSFDDGSRRRANAVGGGRDADSATRVIGDLGQGLHGFMHISVRRSSRHACQKRKLEKEILKNNSLSPPTTTRVTALEY